MSGWAAWLLSDTTPGMSVCTIVGNNGAHYATKGKTANATSTCSKTKAHHNFYVNGIFDGKDGCVGTKVAKLTAGSPIYISGPNGKIKFMMATDCSPDRDNSVLMVMSKADSNPFGKMCLIIAKAKTCSLVSLAFGKDFDQNQRNITVPLCKQQQALIDAGY